MASDFLTVYIVEVVRRIRSRPFLIGLVVGMLGIVVVAKLPAFVDSHVAGDQGRIVLAGPSSLTTPARSLLAGSYSIEKIQTSTAPPALSQLDALHAGRVVALSDGARGLQVTVYSTGPTRVDSEKIARLLLPLNLQIVLHVDGVAAARAAVVSVTVRGLGNHFRSVEAAETARGVAFTLIFLLYLLVILNSQLTMAGVIEEKTNRIAELLVAAVDPIALLYGKIVAGATLGMLQMIVWVGTAFMLGMRSPGATDIVNLSGALAGALTPLTIGAFVFFLIVGLLQFSTIFAGIGSLISRPEDLGGVSSALVLPIVGALVIALAALDAPNAPFVVASSFVPLIAPFTMFARIAVAQPPMWQIALSAALNVAALAAIALFAGRLYRVGMLLYGRPPSFRQVWTTIRG
jgi:ABC-2 type transport system permease protein